MEGVLFEDIRVFLPRYLNPEHQDKLLEAVRQFPNIKQFYLLNKYEDELLQGDGWRGFVAINFHNGDRKKVSGLVLSNSCDIDVKNPRDGDPNIIFAPLIRVSRFKQILIEAGKSEAAATDKIDTIRRQCITSIFYLPELPHVLEESMAILDDLHQHPLSDFHASEKAKLFTLDQFAFYLFLLKLSIHFTRFNEALPRYSEQPTAVT